MFIVVVVSKPASPNMSSSIDAGSSTSSLASTKKPSKSKGIDSKGKKSQKKHWNQEKDISNQFNKINLGKSPNNTKRNQISLNHLLHYESYKESDDYKTRQHNRKRETRSPRGSFRYLPDKYKEPLRGMGFINLNYKFVVDSTGNYNPQELDPNIPVNKENIIRIIVPKGNACPICLSDEPVAPRMITACGHIICLTCVLSLLDTEIPIFKKRENLAIIEKYKECPLCSSIIRKNEMKPVLINNVDERFETPKIGEDVVMTLMSRPYNRLFAVPRQIEQVHYQIKNVPYVNTNPDISSYLRLFKADLNYILDMYNEEKQQIINTFEQDSKELYNQNKIYVTKAIKEIDDDIQFWTNHYQQQGEKESIAAASKTEEINSGNSFFYYETGFNTTTTYILSPLDIKVLKTNYNNDYGMLPTRIIAKVENIQYEELTPENSLKKYKYLSHLPLGSSIGFIQCDWSKNEYISQETWRFFQLDLTKRSKKTYEKFQKEEQARSRAQNEEERRNKLFFQNENNVFHNVINPRDYVNQDEYDYEPNGSIGSLTIVDNRHLPTLNSRSPDQQDAIESNYETTVWGTKIKKSELPPSDHEDDWDAEEMIRKAKQEMDKANGKKKKKKFILLLSQ